MSTTAERQEQIMQWFRQALTDINRSACTGLEYMAMVDEFLDMLKSSGFGIILNTKTFTVTAWDKNALKP